MPTKSDSQTLFSPKLFQFLKELKANNDREWFAANKSRYEEEVFAPAAEFVSNMKPRLMKHSRYLIAEPKKVGGSIMRIYRDTRFAKDKTPYKTNVGIHFRHSLGGDVHAPGLYLHLEPGSCFVGAGIWMPPSDSLLAVRTAISENTKDWIKVSQNQKFQSMFKLSDDSIKTTPRGFDANHPAIVELRRKNFAGLCPLKDSEILKADIVDRVADLFLLAKPMMKFLCDALHQPY